MTNTERRLLLGVQTSKTSILDKVIYEKKFMKAKSRFANVMREAIDAASRANTPKGVGLEAGVLRKTEVPRIKEQISPIKEEN